MMSVSQYMLKVFIEGGTIDQEDVQMEGVVMDGQSRGEPVGDVPVPNAGSLNGNVGLVSADDASYGMATNGVPKEGGFAAEDLQVTGSTSPIRPSLDPQGMTCWSSSPRGNRG